MLAVTEHIPYDIPRTFLLRETSNGWCLILPQSTCSLAHEPCVHNFTRKSFSNLRLAFVNTFHLVLTGFASAGVKTASSQITQTPGFTHNVAAASIAPAPLKAGLLVISTVTGYFHVIYFAQPIRKYVD